MKKTYLKNFITLITILTFSLLPINVQALPLQLINNNSCQKLEKSLQMLLDKAVEDGLPGVTLTIYKPNCGFIQLASGLSDLKSQKKMTVQDNFRLASCSKPYIGVLIMQLVEEGKISLDDPISKYIDRKHILKIRNASRATIRQLMNHTSGIADYFFGEFTEEANKNPGKLYKLEEAVKFAYNKPAAFSRPGQGYFYSNTNPILLAMILEKVLKIPFTKALETRIYRPLNLSRTYNDYTDSVIEPLARGYFFNNSGEKLDYTDVNQGYGLADGAVVSNGRDMATFLRSLFVTETILKSETFMEMLRVDKAAKSAQDGLNLFVYSDYNNGSYGKMIGHDGEYGGYKSEMFYFPDKDTTVVLLGNGSGNGINKKWKELYDNIILTIFRDEPKA